jgi:hypothetical protein
MTTREASSVRQDLCGLVLEACLAVPQLLGGVATPSAILAHKSAAAEACSADRITVRGYQRTESGSRVFVRFAQYPSNASWRSS